MADGPDIHYGVGNALNEQLPDLTPLFRAAYVFELQEVEKRHDALGNSFGEESKASKDAMETLWRRRNELLSILWPSIDPGAESPFSGGVAPELHDAADGMGC